MTLKDFLELWRSDGTQKVSVDQYVYVKNYPYVKSKGDKGRNEYLKIAVKPIFVNENVDYLLELMDRHRYEGLDSAIVVRSYLTQDNEKNIIVIEIE